MNQRLQSGFLIHAQRPRHPSHPLRVREHGEDRPAEGAIAKAAMRDPLDFGPRRLEQRIVLHARGTRRDARHAPETCVDVLDETFGVRFAAVAPLPHQMDAPTRRVRFLPPQQVGGTGRQTEAAMNAVIKKLARWSCHGTDYIGVRRVGSACRVLGPRFKVARWTSNALLLRSDQADVQTRGFARSDVHIAGECLEPRLLHL